MKAFSKMTIDATTASNTEQGKRPLPNNFEKYLPWAYGQMQGDINILVTRVTQNEYVSIGRATERSKGKPKSKPKNGRSPGSADDSKEESLSWQQPQTDNQALNILATYDTSDNLIHIKFDKNQTVPREVMKIIILIIKFCPHLTGLTINRGLNMAIVHEIQTLLAASFITDVCLDDTFVKEANYHILLETQCALKYLSLARCRIDDKVVKNIASNLPYPSSASKTLSILNLASNRITDLGAKYLAEALRSNRKLSYLNLSDNMITDNGGTSIFSVLVEFSLTEDEIFAMKIRHMSYLKDMNAMVTKIVKELKAGDMERKTARKKTMKPPPVSAGKKSKMERESSAKGLLDVNPKSFVNMDILWQEKASQMAENVMGPFNDPFSPVNTFIKNNSTYCIGNNMLSYLNLAYNDLTFFGVKKLLEAVVTKKMYDRKPRGLVNLCVEGNPMPQDCKELAKLNDVLEMGLIALNRRMSVVKKRPQSKTSSK